MKALNILFLCLCLPIFGCAVSDRVDNRNFAFDTYYPTANEIRLAEQRVQRYWQNNSQRFPNSTRYLAVYTTGVLQADIVQDLYAKLFSSETTASVERLYGKVYRMGKLSWSSSAAAYRPA